MRELFFISVILFTLSSCTLTRNGYEEQDFCSYQIEQLNKFRDDAQKNLEVAQMNNDSVEYRKELSTIKRVDTLFSMVGLCDTLKKWADVRK